MTIRSSGRLLGLHYYHAARDKAALDSGVSRQRSYEVLSEAIRY